MFDEPDAAIADASEDTGPAVSAPGLVKIFDGTSLDNWVYNPRGWSIQEGAFRGDGIRSQAFTKESYSTFRLIVSSRMVQSNDHLGICLWGGRPNAGSYGFERCLLVIPPSGAIWDYLDNSEHRKPANGDKTQWHQTEILANRKTGKVLVAVEGKFVHEYQDPPDQLARRQHGPIGLQNHSGGSAIVEYKDISIEVDPKDEKLITLKP